MNNNKRAVQIGLLVVLVAAGVIAYVADRYGRAPNLAPTSISLDVPHDESLVLLDGEQVAQISSGGQTVTVDNVSDGSHTIVVGSTGRWPWFREVLIPIANNKVMMPVQFIQQPETAPAEGDSPALSLPTGDAPIKNSDGVELFVQDNRIFVRSPSEGGAPGYLCDLREECTGEIEVYPLASQSAQAITSVDFLDSERGDTIIYAATSNIPGQAGIFALSLEGGETRAFSPVALSAGGDVALPNAPTFGDIEGFVRVDNSTIRLIRGDDQDLLLTLSY